MIIRLRFRLNFIDIKSASTFKTEQQLLKKLFGTIKTNKFPYNELTFTVEDHTSPTHPVHKVTFNHVRLLHVVGSLDGHEEDIDAGLPGETGRLLHLVRGPSVHQHHRHVGRAPSVAVGVAEVLLVDVAEGLSCPCARGQQRDGFITSHTHSHTFFPLVSESQNE